MAMRNTDHSPDAAMDPGKGDALTKVAACGGDYSFHFRRIPLKLRDVEYCAPDFECAHPCMILLLHPHLGLHALTQHWPPDLRRLWQNCVHNSRRAVKFVDSEHCWQSVHEISNIASISTLMFSGKL